MSHKVYPENARLRHQSKTACNAIKRLQKMGIQLISIDFSPPNPLIMIAHCPGTQDIESTIMGQGIRQGTGKPYITRKTSLCGCEINWNEEVK